MPGAHRSWPAFYRVRPMRSTGMCSGLPVDPGSSIDTDTCTDPCPAIFILMALLRAAVLRERSEPPSEARVAWPFFRGVDPVFPGPFRPSFRVCFSTPSAVLGHGLAARSSARHFRPDDRPIIVSSSPP